MGERGKESNSKASKSSPGHDSNLLAQNLSLFHGMRGKNDSPSRFSVINDIPDKSANFRIKSGCGFVQENHLSVSNKGNGDREPSFFSSREIFGETIFVLGEGDGIHGLLNCFLLLFWGYSLDSSIKEEVFLNCQIVPEDIVLWTHPLILKQIIINRGRS